MAQGKGSSLEELVRAFFSKQGYYCLRGVSYTFEGQEVTDIDVWLYGKQGASVRTRAIVDVKNKKSPKAMERVLWVRGLQASLRCDRAIIATTDTDPRISRYAKQQGVSVLSKSFITRLELGVDVPERLTEEEFLANIKSYSAVKQDGDWISILKNIRSAVVSTEGFSSFNIAAAAFRTFSVKIQTRLQNSEQATRCAYLAASIACISLDSALSFRVYDDVDSRYAAIISGVRYGDSGDAKVHRSIASVLEVIASRMENGKATAAAAKNALEEAFKSVRAEIIAEVFSKDQSGVNLFRVAKSLEERSHARDSASLFDLSVEEKSVLGILSDFLEVPRTAVISANRYVFKNQGASAVVHQEIDSAESAQNKLI